MMVLVVTGYQHWSDDLLHLLQSELISLTAVVQVCGVFKSAILCLPTRN